MATLAAGPKLGRVKTQRSKEVSIREVCLIGEARLSEWPAPGDRIVRDGRNYRVEAVQVVDDDDDGGGGRLDRYLHLMAEQSRRSGV